MQVFVAPPIRFHAFLARHFTRPEIKREKIRLIELISHLSASSAGRYLSGNNHPQGWDGPLFDLDLISGGHYH